MSSCLADGLAVPRHGDAITRPYQGSQTLVSPSVRSLLNLGPTKLYGCLSCPPLFTRQGFFYVSELATLHTLNNVEVAGIHPET